MEFFKKGPDIVAAARARAEERQSHIDQMAAEEARRKALANSDNEGLMSPDAKTAAREDLADKRAKEQEAIEAIREAISTLR